MVMENQLKEQLLDYRGTTLKLIKALEEENYEVLDELLSERQKFLDNLSLISHTKDELSEVYSELELLKLDKGLTELMRGKLDEVRNNINKLAESKSARKSYNQKLNVDALYLNKKI
jgi:hypothetical protein